MTTHEHVKAHFKWLVILTFAFFLLVSLLAVRWLLPRKENYTELHKEVQWLKDNCLMKGEK